MRALLNRFIEPRIQIEESKKIFSNSDLKSLIIPIIIEQFLALLVGIADTLMISHAGEAAISGVGLINQLNSVFIMIFTALAAGGAVVVSHYIGNKDSKNATFAASQMVMIVGVISLVLMVIVLGFGSFIFRLLFGEVENAVYEAGMTYLRISALSFPFLALYNGCAGMYRSMGKTKTIMYVSLAMNVINVIGNSIGIFVLHAGVRGVAYPSLISRAFAAIFMLTIAFKKRNIVTLELKKIFTWNMLMIKRIFTIAIPNSIESSLFQLAKVALSSILAVFGTVQIASYTVAQSFWSMAALFIIAMGPAFITVIGQSMGSGDIEASRYYMNKLLRITYIGGILWNAFFITLIPLMLYFYDLSSEAVGYVLIIAVMHNTGNALFCPLSFALSTGLRAAGDAKFTMYASIFTSVVCRVSLSILFARILGMGVIGITLAMMCDWVIKAVIIMWRYKSGKWESFKLI